MKNLLVLLFVLILNQCLGNSASNNNDGQNYVMDIIRTKYRTVDRLHALVQDAVDYAHNVGLIVRPSGSFDRSDLAEIASFTLFPSPIPREPYEEIVAVQKAMQLLYFRISCDHKFLENAHRQVIDSDPVLNKMFEIMREVRAEGIKQPLTILIMRADYMLNVVENKVSNEKEYEFKQVEVNVGPVGGAGLMFGATKMHRWMLKQVGMDASPEKLPENPCATTLAEALYVAWQKFEDPKAVILIVLHKTEKDNLRWDKRPVQYEIERLSGRKAKTVMLSMAQVGEKTKLADDFSLQLEGGQKVAVVYYTKAFNIGQTPMHDWEWDIVKAIERSTAIKSPSISLALSDTKKIQQVLAQPGTVEHFFPDKKDAATVAAIRKTFAGLWALENSKDKSTQRAIKDAIAHPERYVLKPNREGGGNNIWGAELAKKLDTFTPEERAGHILMQKLNPMITPNVMVRANKESLLVSLVNEFSLYGGLVGNQLDKSVLHNGKGGYCMRSKYKGLNEGGVNTGAGLLDSPYLF